MVVIMDCQFSTLLRCFEKMLMFLRSCENIVLWRGHFNATGAGKSVNISVNGGEGSLSLTIEL